MAVLTIRNIDDDVKATPDGAVRDWLRLLQDTSLTTTALTVAEIDFGLRRLPAGRR